MIGLSERGKLESGGDCAPMKRGWESRKDITILNSSESRGTVPLKP